MDHTKSLDALQREARDAERRGQADLERLLKTVLGIPTAIKDSDQAARFGDTLQLYPHGSDIAAIVPTPAFSDKGRILAVKHVSDESGNVVIRGGTSGVLIDGQPTLTLTARGWAILVATEPERYISFQGYSATLRDGDAAAAGGDWITTIDRAKLQWEYLPASAGPARKNTRLVYNPVEDAHILFGGQGPSPYPIYGDTWQFKDEVWTQLPTSASPSARINASMCWDPIGKRILLMSGYDPVLADETLDLWEFDPLTPTWNQLTTWTSPPGPAGRQNPGICVDPYKGTAGTLVVFSGSWGAGSSGHNDIWSCDLSTYAWTQRKSDTPADPTPSIRQGPDGYYYDPIRRKIIIIGGVAGSINMLEDVWELETATWSRTNVTPIPWTPDVDYIWHTSGGQGCPWVPTLKGGLYISGQQAWITPSGLRMGVHLHRPADQEWVNLSLIIEPDWNGEASEPLANVPHRRDDYQLSWDTKRNCAYIHYGNNSPAEMWRLQL